LRVSKAKSLKGKYETEIDFQERWWGEGRVVQTKRFSMEGYEYFLGKNTFSHCGHQS